MSIGYCPKTRRQFLIGSGKSLLAIPLLPSLLPREALAQATETPRRAMLFWFDHNNLLDLWPNASAATTPVGSDGTQEVLLRSLGSASSISPVFSNSRYETLKNADQISILRGFDTAVSYGPGHGNYTLACGEGRNSEGNYPTLDSIVENSSTLYPTGTPVSVRKALRVNFLPFPRFYEKIGNSVQSLPYYAGSGIQTFYNEVFSSLTNGSVPQQDFTNQLKSNILNRVFQSYGSFRSGRKISSQDRARLEQHMDYISDLQRSVENAQTGPSCTAPANPGNIGGDPLQYIGVYMELLAVAFKCGITKFGILGAADDPLWTLSNDFHGSIHGNHGNSIQLQAFQNWWGYYTDAIADHFLTPMSEMEGDTGRTYLDNMITGMVCAGGLHGLGNDGGHSGLNSQQILIGSMGGRMRSGRYYVFSNGQNNGRRMPYNCFLITLMHLMGVPPSDYAYATPNGLGLGYYAQFAADNPYQSRFYSPLTEVLT